MIGMQFFGTPVFLSKKICFIACCDLSFAYVLSLGMKTIWKHRVLFGMWRGFALLRPRNYT
jgi:hypothetical protein